MNEFRLEGKQGYIHIRLEKIFGFPLNTSHFGGYDAKGTVEIQSGNYYVIGELYLSTGDIYLFYEKLKSCYSSLEGEVTFNNYEVNLDIKLTFNSKGHVLLNGRFKEYQHIDNELIFEIESDQSYMVSSLSEIEKIVNKYGDMKGRKT